MPTKHIALMLALLFSLTACAEINTQQAIGAGVSVLQATTLDENSVKQTASLAAKELDGKSEVAPASSSYNQRLARLTQGLTNFDGLNLNYKVYIADEVNAFAMADGTVRVYSGLMDLMPDDEVLAVIFHEIGHVKLNHSYQQMKEQLLTNAAFQTAGSVGGIIGSLTSSQLGQIAHKAINARFSQSDELEADAYAVKALKNAGKDPYAMRRSLETLEAKYGSGSPVSFLSTHPSNQTRKDKILEAIQAL